MTTQVFIRVEADPAFETVANVVRKHDDGIESSVKLPAGEEVELGIHDNQYLKIVEFDAEQVEDDSDSNPE